MQQLQFEEKGDEEVEAEAEATENQEVDVIESTPMVTDDDENPF